MARGELFVDGGDYMGTRHFEYTTYDRGIDIEWGHDPCDQMVTVEQALSFFTDQMRPGWPHVDKLYERIAAILGVSREEAKRAAYVYTYSG